ncbi:hypothetical protein, partial [Mesorhizobium sp. YM1C-6-2]|uniref:hypothetical protein n=1 Tax=Mesorhizobium sp. YM1C-6-2 TaxID=1827501 RepID=UPI001AEC752A
LAGQHGKRLHGAADEDRGEDGCEPVHGSFPLFSRGEEDARKSRTAGAANKDRGWEHSAGGRKFIPEIP